MFLRLTKYGIMNKKLEKKNVKDDTKLSLGDWVNNVFINIGVEGSIRNNTNC